MNTFLTVIGTAASLVALLQVLVVAYLHKRKTWRQIQTEIDKLHKGLDAKQFTPDAIVTFANGGLIAADLLHMKFYEHIPIICLKLDITRPAKGMKTVRVEANGKVLSEIQDKKILVLDDVVQNGVTLAAVVDFLVREVGCADKDIFTAVLGRPEGAKAFAVDYCGFEYAVKVKLPWGEVPRHSA